MKRIHILFLGALTLLSAPLAAFELEVQQVADGAYALIGAIAPRTSENHGLNNTLGFVVTNQGVVLRIGDRIETGLPGRIVYDGVPSNLRDKPTLVSELASRRAF